MARLAEEEIISSVSELFTGDQQTGIPTIRTPGQPGKDLPETSGTVTAPTYNPGANPKF